MKTLLLSVLIASSSSAIAACIVPDEASLRTKWQSFRSDAVLGKPERMTPYFKFPLKLMSPFHDGKPAMVSQAAFSKHYQTLFVSDVDGAELEIRRDLLKLTGSERFSRIHFDQKKCSLQAPVDVADYVFTFHQQRGWLITAVRYGDDFFAIESDLKGR